MGLILGYLISASGATPINFTPLYKFIFNFNKFSRIFSYKYIILILNKYFLNLPRLKTYFSIPLEIPESIIIASVLKAALAIPAKNYPLPVSFAPIKLMIGYLNFSIK